MRLLFSQFVEEAKWVAGQATVGYSVWAFVFYNPLRIVFAFYVALCLVLYFRVAQKVPVPPLTPRPLSSPLYPCQDRHQGSGAHP